MKLSRCCAAALLTLISADLVYGGALKSAFVKDGASEHIKPGENKEAKEAEPATQEESGTSSDTSSEAESTTAETPSEESSDTSSANEGDTKKADDKKIEGDPTVAVIGKDNIKRSAILKEIQKLPPQIIKNAKPDQIFQMARDQYVSSLLMLRAAKKAGVNKEKEFVERLEEIKDRLLVEAYIAKNVGAQAPTESVLKARYTKYLVEFKKQKETHVFHIVVDTEKKAKEVIAKLAKGGDFKKLINEYSLYKDHADEGTWFVLDVLPPQLKDPLTKLKKGEYTKDPVKMGNMFAVFKVDGTRDSQPLKYEDAKGVLSQLIMQEKLRDLVLKLIKQYDAKVFKEDGSADNFSMMGGK